MRRMRRPGSWRMDRQPLAWLLLPGQCLEVIVTAACYREETSDSRSAAAAPPSTSPWGEDKSAVCRLATNCFFCSTLPLVSFLLLFHPSSRLPPPAVFLYSNVSYHSSHCSVCTKSSSSPGDLLSLSTSPLSSGNEAPHCPHRSQSSIKRSESKIEFTEVKETQGWAQKQSA